MTIKNILDKLNWEIVDVDYITINEVDKKFWYTHDFYQSEYINKKIKWFSVYVDKKEYVCWNFMLEE